MLIYFSVQRILTVIFVTLCIIHSSAIKTIHVIGHILYKIQDKRTCLVLYIKTGKNEFVLSHYTVLILYQLCFILRVLSQSKKLPQ